MKDTDFLPKKEGPKVEIKILEAFDEKVLREILDLEKESFPESWQYEDAKEYYRGKLMNERNISVAAIDGGKITGYMLMVPHNDMVEEIGEDDPEMGYDPERFYVETMEIHPDYRKSLRGGKLFAEMVERGLEELRKRTIKGFAMHARTTNKLNEAVKKFFKERITLVRQIESWKHGGGETYEYLEGDV